MKHFIRHEDMRTLFLVFLSSCLKIYSHSIVAGGFEVIS